MAVALKLANVDNTIEWLIEKELTRIEYYPDKDLFKSGGYGTKSWGQVIQEHKDSLKFIDIKGVSNYKDKGEIADAVIYVERNSETPTPFANLANNTFVYESYEKEVEQDGETVTRTFYRKYKVSDTTFDIEYSVRFVTQNTKNTAINPERNNIERDITTLLLTLFGRRIYVDTVVNETRELIEGAEFYIVRQSPNVNLSGTDFIERVFTFNVENIYLLSNFNLVEEDIPQIEQINVVTVPRKFSEGIEDETPIT